MAARSQKSDGVLSRVLDRGEVYYCAAERGMALDGTSYLPGFNVAAHLKILGVAATLTVTVDPATASRRGVRWTSRST